MTTSGGYVLASDNKGACVQDQTPQKKSATGTGTLTFSSYGIPHIYLEVQKYFGTMHFTSFHIQTRADREETVYVLF